MPISIPPDERRSAKPSWLKVRAPGSPEYLQTRAIVKGLKLHTVCEEARCPNAGDCWSHGTATIMVLGDYCSRGCRFCAVKKGTLLSGRENSILPPDPAEPENVGIAVAKLGLRHAVVTSVTRDDLPDGGAAHFAATVSAIHRHAPACKVELLISDLQGARKDLEVILSAGVDILNHNLETVRRLYKDIRPNAVYERSLDILRWSHEISRDALTKSGIMVGLGETRDEVLSLMDDLRCSNVDILTIGQYLRPSPEQIAVREFVTPDEFEEYKGIGLGKGFKYVESGALVRSSYHAWKHTDCGWPE